MKRIVLLAVLLVGANARADMGMLPGGATLKFNRLFLHEDNQEEGALAKTDPDSYNHYFNLAHCVCSFDNFNPDSGSYDPTYYEDTFAWELMLTGYTTPINKPVDIFTGTMCDSTMAGYRDANCTKVGSQQLSAIAPTMVTKAEISIYDLLHAKDKSMEPGCPKTVQPGTTWALVDTDGDGVYDYSLAADLKYPSDTEPPPMPTEFKALGAENAIEISWTPPAAGVADIQYYQALCEETSTKAPVTSSPATARYQTARHLCNGNDDAALLALSVATDSDVDAGDGSIVYSDELGQLDPAYICGESTSSTATSMRITGLKNGVEYTVFFLAIDKAGNATSGYFTQPLVPKPATDFWEDLHSRGSGAEGGFCLLAQTYGDDNPLTQALRAFRDDTLASTALGRLAIDAYYGSIGHIDLHGIIALRVLVGTVMLPFVAFALLWHLITLPGILLLAGLLVLARRRRLAQLRLAGAAAAFALLVLAPTKAHAQSPYWENEAALPENEEMSYGDPHRVSWNAGLRLGPYVPAIDSQLGMPIGKSDGPYEAMFGGYAIMPVLDVERFFWREFGQLGAGISLGYMGKKAHTWEANSDPADPKRPRSAGDSNTFRLFPLSVSAVYRLTVLDDEYGIPIVPYARGGLAYYIWWVKAPNGNFAKTCVDGSTDSMCPKTTAAGASLGVVGSLGLAIRAERIDTAAARSMHESGLEHAGFYAEYSFAKVDGFGSDKKLSVGDVTWFAGVNFEF